MTVAYIISLAYTETNTEIGNANKQHALSRINLVESSSKQFNWDIQPWPAVDGYGVNAETLPYQIKTKTLGALGCCLSHLSLWKLCESKNENIIVLEDDVSIISHCVLDPTHELLKLHVPRNIRGKPLMRNHKLYGNWAPGAYAYLLTPIAAKKLIYWVKKNGLYPVDKIIGSNIVDWNYSANPLTRLILHSHSSTR